MDASAHPAADGDGKRTRVRPRSDEGAPNSSSTTASHSQHARNNNNNQRRMQHRRVENKAAPQSATEQKAPARRDEQRQAAMQKPPRVSPSSSTPSASPAPASRLHHPFKANFNDHFETSTEALQDVLPVISELRQLLRPSTPELFTLYDPYYCAGTVVTAWQALGVQRVLHDNRDFYADIAQGTVPAPYDMLVTNPPFSEDHIWRLLDFLVTQPQQPMRPWAFVAPDYIAAKPQYKAWVERYFTRTAAQPSPGPAGAVKGAVRRPPPPIPSIASILPPFLDGHEEDEQEVGEGHGAASAPASTSVGPEPFYLVPRTRYDYAHPLGVGHDHSHFKSMWYVWAGRHTSEVLRGVSVALAGRARSGAAVSVVPGYQALVEGEYVAATGRRLNPERRQRTVPERGGRGRR